MTTEFLTEQIHKKQSFLCIGLDTDVEKIPKHLASGKDAIFQFNRAIINATHHLAVAYKPNTAFYEAQGLYGWQQLEKTITYLNKNHPEIFTIADAKRGDIGNTSKMYARTFFETMGFDSVTVAPYMGHDSVEPFLQFKNKHVILLALTSN
ncbi:MAG: orotidine-5'-phosphate decarboxylase, partial [Marinirhabdus sp.]